MSDLTNILEDLDHTTEAGRLEAAKGIINSEERWTPLGELVLCRAVYHDPNAGVRLACVEALAARRGDDLMSALAHRALEHVAAYDPTPELREVAGKALGDYAECLSRERTEAQRFVREARSRDYVPALLQQA